MSDDPLLRPSKAAHILDVSTRTIHAWCREGRIKFTIIGNRYRIRASVVEDIAQNGMKRAVTNVADISEE